MLTSPVFVILCSETPEITLMRLWFCKEGKTVTCGCSMIFNNLLEFALPNFGVYLEVLMPFYWKIDVIWSDYYYFVDTEACICAVRS